MQELLLAQLLLDIAFTNSTNTEPYLLKRKKMRHRELRRKLQNQKIKDAKQRMLGLCSIEVERCFTQPGAQRPLIAKLNNLVHLS